MDSLEKKSPFDLLRNTPLVFKAIIGIAFLLAVLLMIIYRTHSQNSNTLAGNSTIPDFSHNSRKMAPNIAIRRADGSPANLSDFKGKVVLLSFWATWCGPCLEELPSFAKLKSEINQNDFVIVPVNVDDELETAKPFITSFFQKESIPFPSYFDTDKIAADHMEVSSIPTNFLIDKEGRVAFSATGAQDWSDSTVKDLVLEILREKN